MKYILIFLLLFSCSTVRADVEIPEAITDRELPGIWNAIDGNGLLVYRLKIDENLVVVLLSTYRSTEAKGMDVFPEGKIRNVGGNLNFSFSESPTTYSELNLIGKGFSCNEGECLLILRKSMESKPIYFYKEPLAVLARKILSAEGVFEEYTP